METVVLRVMECVGGGVEHVNRCKRDEDGVEFHCKELDTKQVVE